MSKIRSDSRVKARGFTTVASDSSFEQATNILCLWKSQTDICIEFSKFEGHLVDKSGTGVGPFEVVCVTLTYILEDLRKIGTLGKLGDHWALGSDSTEGAKQPQNLDFLFYCIFMWQFLKAGGVIASPASLVAQPLPLGFFGTFGEPGNILWSFLEPWSSLGELFLTVRIDISCKTLWNSNIFNNGTWNRWIVEPRASLSRLKMQLVMWNWSYLLSLSI